MKSREQFFSMYTQYQRRKMFQDYTNRAKYKHWNNWCFRESGNASYFFDKGYYEDYCQQQKLYEQQLED